MLIILEKSRGGYLRVKISKIPFREVIFEQNSLKIDFFLKLNFFFLFGILFHVN